MSSSDTIPKVDENGQPLSKSALKKLAAKAEKEAKKAARAAELAAELEQQQLNEPDNCTENYGDMEMVQSQKITETIWTNIEELDERFIGKTATLRGRVHSVRAKGKGAFLILRQGSETLQVAFFVDDVRVSKPMVKYIGNLNKESVVDITGELVKPEQPIESCSNTIVEMTCPKIFCVSRSIQIPLEISDLSRSEADIDNAPEDKQYSRVNQDTRLDNRILDLRTPANNSIFRVQSEVSALFRETLRKRDMIEIHSPKLISGASEGGASVFKLDYMGQPACLAQSPQLYKQMAIMADFGGVFEIGPVFRAENSNTHRHLCEFTGLDFEMTIKEHYSEVLDVIDELFVNMFDGLSERCAKQLEVINAQYPFAPLKYLRKSLRLEFPDGIKMLHEAGITEADPHGDLSTEHERILGKLVKEKYDTDFYILTRYPIEARPFYTMPEPGANPEYTNSFDVFIRGEEIISGAQRIHDPELLTERAKHFGIPVEELESYIRSFRYGALPHGGCGVGLERVVMLYLGLNNIRKSSMFPRDPKRLTP